MRRYRSGFDGGDFGGRERFFAGGHLEGGGALDGLEEKALGGVAGLEGGAAGAAFSAAARVRRSRPPMAVAPWQERQLAWRIWRAASSACAATQRMSARRARRMPIRYRSFGRCVLSVGSFLPRRSRGRGRISRGWTRRRSGGVGSRVRGGWGIERRGRF